MRRLASLLAFIAFAAPTAHAQTAAPPSTGSATLQLNAGPGRALSWRTAVKPNAPVLLWASFDHLQPSEQWGPLISVCLHQTLADQEEVCLRLAPDKDGEIIAKVVNFPEDEVHELSHSRDRSILLDRGKPVRVQLQLGAERVEFLVNDKLLHVYESPVMHHGLSLACSSAICTLGDIQ